MWRGRAAKARRRRRRGNGASRPVLAVICAYGRRRTGATRPERDAGAPSLTAEGRRRRAAGRWRGPDYEKKLDADDRCRSARNWRSQLRVRVSPHRSSIGGNLPSWCGRDAAADAATAESRTSRTMLTTVDDRRRGVIMHVTDAWPTTPGSIKSLSRPAIRGEAGPPLARTPKCRRAVRRFLGLLGACWSAAHRAGREAVGQRGRLIRDRLRAGARCWPRRSARRRGAGTGRWVGIYDRRGRAAA